MSLIDISRDDVTVEHDNGTEVQQRQYVLEAFGHRWTLTVSEKLVPVAEDDSDQ